LINLYTLVFLFKAHVYMGLVGNKGDGVVVLLLVVGGDGDDGVNLLLVGGDGACGDGLLVFSLNSSFTS
jgi:hypothetical protein